MTFNQILMNMEKLGDTTRSTDTRYVKNAKKSAEMTRIVEVYNAMIVKVPPHLVELQLVVNGGRQELAKIVRQ